MLEDRVLVVDVQDHSPRASQPGRDHVELAVIGIPAHDLMKTPEALKVVGPEAFGYPELEYVPLASSLPHKR